MNKADVTGAYPADAPAVPTSLPPRIGRYRVERLLGDGGFGCVYLAWDEQLERWVALKVPHKKHIERREHAELYLNEARTVAGLDHPHIVPVFDVGSCDEFPCFIVCKYIDGTTLAQQIRSLRFTANEAAQHIMTIADALHYAHVMGFVHRDIKPGNILVDATGTPHVVDFGLALKEENIGTGPRFAGTTAYMSPEQARGEGHRVDGRSDVFSLGVVFYELLTGRRPFKADTKAEYLTQITEHEPKPPRQLDDHIPKELERICFKAMAKRAADRYTTAKDLADDLRHYLSEDAVSQMETRIYPDDVSQPAPSAVSTPSGAMSPTSHLSVTAGPPLRIVPKGLRSFDAHDADFFLELLPGARDRDNLPDSIRFWKQRIEETDGDQTFAVGLIYGPSGCGKSSLVKAGLLPRLAHYVSSVYVEATVGDTESRLLNGLRKRCSGLPGDANLKDTIAALRRGQGLATGQKLLIVLDQFEQWLHANRDESNTELVQALRQCDGGRVQCIVMVRDDFWMGATRLMRDLEARLVEGENSAAVDLFPIRHAEKVLAAFGRAFNILPESPRELNPEQKRFLQDAVQGLAQEGKIICVRLALFAEMMKSKPWTPATLKEVGGTRGVGETFLEETFSAATAPPLHHYHQKAARAVLQALLPEPGADIKGHMRSRGELLEASGYTHRPMDFDELMRILDSELRLITPTEPERKDEGGRMKDEKGAAQGSCFILPPSSFQLTHDYLVPSLRDWLTRKKKETRRGRAELLLADRAAIWNARPENRLLPSFLQWANIHILTQKKHWTDSQRTMMQRANRYYGLRGVIFLIALALLSAGGYEAHGRMRANALRDRLLEASTADVPGIVREMDPYRRWLDPLLREANAQAAVNEDRHKRLHASLALLPSDAGQVDYLLRRLLDAEPDEMLVIRAALVDHQRDLAGRLWAFVEDPASAHGQRLRAAGALAEFDPNSARWPKVAGDVAATLVTQDPFVVARWTEIMRPAGKHLLGPLTDFLLDEKRSYAERGLLAKVYAACAVKTPSPGSGLEKCLAESCDPTASSEARLIHCKKQASCATALMVMGRAEQAWPLLKHQSDPTLRSFILERIAAAGVDPKSLVARLEREADVSIQRAIVLSLGDYGIGRLPAAERDQLRPRIGALYRDHPDPGIHGAADWVLRQWQADPDVRRLDKDLATGKIEANRQWYVSKVGLTMVVVGTPGLVTVGEKKSKRTRRVNRRIAIAAKEVTLEQFLRFHPNHVFKTPIATTLDCPAMGLSWFEAAEYCNWLSAQDGIAEDQWCYVPNADGQLANGMSLAPDWWRRTGYRLPTEAEWVYACRAGAETDFYFGKSFDLVKHYVWNAANSTGRSHPVGAKKPNDFGLFDMHGNVWEWSQDACGDNGEPMDDKEAPAIIDNDRRRVLLGAGWGNQTTDLRPAFHIWNAPTHKSPAVGFRPVRVLAEAN